MSPLPAHIALVGTGWRSFDLTLVEVWLLHICKARPIMKNLSVLCSSPARGSNNLTDTDVDTHRLSAAGGCLKGASPPGGNVRTVCPLSGQQPGAAIRLRLQSRDVRLQILGGGDANKGM